MVYVSNFLKNCLRTFIVDSGILVFCEESTRRVRLEFESRFHICEKKRQRTEKHLIFYFSTLCYSYNCIYMYQPRNIFCTMANNCLK